jgi:hypothetical protein
VQLYNEILTDLLEDPREANNHVKLVGVSDVNSDLLLVSERTGEKIGTRVRNADEALELYRVGSARKEVSKTKMNDTSSRSHCIFTMEISRRPRTLVGGGAGAAAATSEGDDGAPTAGAAAASAPRALEGKLILCDLAGSERVGKTGAKDRQLQEAAHINGSLLVLGKVVAALTDKSSQHVPFRESKLTRMLQYSLSGYGKTSLVVNVSPSDYNTDETVSAIMFGQRAIQIKESAKQHVILDYKALYLQLQGQIDTQLESAVESAVRDVRREHDLEVRDLRARIRELEQERDLLRRAGGGGSGNGGDGTAPAQAPTSAATGETAALMRGMDELRAAHEATLQGLMAERDELREQCADAKARIGVVEGNLFAVARKFEAFRTVAAARQQAWLAKMNELGAEIAAGKQSDFLAFDSLDEALSAGSASGSAAGSAAVSPRNAGAAGPARATASGGGGGGGGADEAELERAYLVIQALQQERQQLIIYQHKAKQAIRMLFAETQQLAARLEAKK